MKFTDQDILDASSQLMDVYAYRSQDMNLNTLMLCRDQIVAVGDLLDLLAISYKRKAAMFENDLKEEEAALSFQIQQEELEIGGKKKYPSATWADKEARARLTAKHNELVQLEYLTDLAYGRVSWFRKRSDAIAGRIRGKEDSDLEKQAQVDDWYPSIWIFDKEYVGAIRDFVANAHSLGSASAPEVTPEGTQEVAPEVAVVTEQSPPAPAAEPEQAPPSAAPSPILETEKQELKRRRRLVDKVKKKRRRKKPLEASIPAPPEPKHSSFKQTPKTELPWETAGEEE